MPPKGDMSMIKSTTPQPSTKEALLAELAEATFRVAKRYGFQGAFIDIELDLWDAASQSILGQSSPVDNGASGVCPTAS
jgi:hypothetical protein